ncbi:hypothetical protein QZH41_017642 [Actinostola sp. cb2023]|nr:hypothetical protein QZH41_017642 [Actinostola sp. cb2023]
MHPFSSLIHSFVHPSTQPSSHVLKSNNQTFKWYKYASELPGSNSHVTVQNEYVTVNKLTPSDSALYHAEVETEGGKEVTRYWLTVKDCDVHEKKTSLNGNCDVKNSEKSIACEAQCEAGWYYFSDKCFKYISSSIIWEDAHTFCQSSGARLATINSNDENTFVGKLLQTGDGGWIGLNDKSQESNYIWNYQRDPKPTFFAWDKSNPKNEEPNNSNGGCNIENCVEMKHTSKRWNDAVCTAQFGYICQQYSKEGVYVWNDVGVDQFQNVATYFNWDTKEPNDKLYDKLLPRCTGEDCVKIKKWNGSVTWSDLGCSTTLPFVCEKQKDMYISFAAWIAISMGTGLVLSILVARGYMEYKSKRGKKEIKAALITDNANFRT